MAVAWLEQFRADLSRALNLKGEGPPQYVPVGEHLNLVYDVGSLVDSDPASSSQAAVKKLVGQSLPVYQDLPVTGIDYPSIHADTTANNQFVFYESQTASCYFKAGADATEHVDLLPGCGAGAVFPNAKSGIYMVEMEFDFIQQKTASSYKRLRIRPAIVSLTDVSGQLATISEIYFLKNYLESGDDSDVGRISCRPFLTNLQPDRLYGAGLVINVNSNYNFQFEHHSIFNITMQKVSDERLIFPITS